MNRLLKAFSTLLLCFISTLVSAQVKYAYVYGKVTDKAEKPVEDVHVEYAKNGISTKTLYDGSYRIKVESNQLVVLTFSYVGKKQNIQTIDVLRENQEYELNITLDTSVNMLKPFVVKQPQKKHDPVGVITMQPKGFRKVPGLQGVESIIKTLPGVASGNELSAQYNVRGGSYDENLIYVNDFEIYRPQLVRTGQQEGLSFLNGDLVNNISFSAGGFEARYGDRLSSVLDVAYKPADTSRFYGVSAGLMGINLFGSNAFNIKKFVKVSYLAGIRYRTNQYILGTLDVKGQFQSRFIDAQSLVTFDFYKRLRFWSIEWLTYAGDNQYKILPVSQETSFGTVQTALKLFVAMRGQEIMNYGSAFSGVSAIYKPHKQFTAKFMVSGVTSNESEHYDVLGAYRIDQLDNNQGSAQFGQSKFSLGNGFFINHARNDLYYNSYNVSTIGKYIVGKKTGDNWNWGLKYQKEFIDDNFKEWKYNDSADYNSNFSGFSLDSIVLSEYIRSAAKITNERLSGHLQRTTTLSQRSNMVLTSGIRFHHAVFNNQTVVSPRFQFSFEPNKNFNDSQIYDSLKKKDVAVKFAAGVYHQPPFYREFRRFDGSLNNNLKAQQSIHLVAGADWLFKAWDRTFKFFAEAYYKKMDYLVPYLLDNVRIRYYGDNSARGYAAGFDARVNGEFIKDLESWFTFSFLKTNEIIAYEGSNGEKLEANLRRPTDRRVSVAVLFQDELPNNPDYRVHLNLVFGSGLPYYLGGEARYKELFKIPAYRRVDVGFTKTIVKEEEASKKNKHISNMWVSLEVFNLLQINNVISYLWVKDIQNNIYGVPGYLTGRRINLQFFINFK